MEREWDRGGDVLKEHRRRDIQLEMDLRMGHVGCADSRRETCRYGMDGRDEEDRNVTDERATCAWDTGAVMRQETDAREEPLDGFEGEGQQTGRDGMVWD
jgi:hypothetical protein